jgi:glycosyltransferase involved in cell wall biosynthesis
VAHRVAVVVTARNEAERLPATLAAVREAFPGAAIVVADDASTDATGQLALQAGADVVTAERPLGKGGAATLGARRALTEGPAAIVLCDADLAGSARQLPALVRALEERGADLAVATFARRTGGGFGFAVGFARWAIRRLTGLELGAPISGQRALRPDALRAALPFAPRFGMEIGMTVDVARAGLRVVEVELALEHRATGRTLGGFLHRARQLRDFVRVYAVRASGRRERA